MGGWGGGGEGGGVVGPSALAVFMLMTSSIFVGCSTGRSAGLAPFRILWTRSAAWRKFEAQFGPYDMKAPSRGPRSSASIVGWWCRAANSMILLRNRIFSGLGRIMIAWALCVSGLSNAIL